MSLNWSQDVQDRLNGPEVAVLYFVEGQMDDGPFYATNALIDYNWDGKAWSGVGGAIQEIVFTERGETLAPISVEFKLSTFAKPVLAALLARNYQKRRLRMWEAFADARTGELLEAPGLPRMIFGGRISRMGIDMVNDGDGGKNVVIMMRASSVMEEWAREPNVNFTQEEQERLFPGEDDRAFQYVARRGTQYP